MPQLKIYFRYLFARLLMPFVVCLAACTLIWIMVDIYGNLENFLEHKGSFGTTIWIIVKFYSLQVPTMLVLVLPAALLISTMWTLLALNRRSELVAFQAGGMAPFWLFLPFLVFSLIWMAVLFFDMNWPAPVSLGMRDRLLKQAQGQGGKSDVYQNLPYNDRRNRRIWFFESLDINQDKARGLSILDRDADGNDIRQYFARSGEYTPGGFWRLNTVTEKVYDPSGGVEQTKDYEQLDTDITTPPKQISLVVSAPEEMTVSQLSQYIVTSTSTPENMAKFRTEWWYRMLYPLSALVLTLYGLMQGARIDRRGAAAGVFKTILLLVAYMTISNLVVGMGNFNKLPPFLAAVATPVAFGIVGLWLLAGQYGWWWQMLELAREWWGKANGNAGQASAGGELNG